MKLPKPIGFAMTGWLAGAVAGVVVGSAWPVIFPAIVIVKHYYGAGPGILTIIAFSTLIASPGGVLGGIIGSRIPREGGFREQIWMAGIMGVLFSLPFACMMLWFFTGW